MSIQKLDPTPPVQGESSTLIRWAQRVATAVNALIDSLAAITSSDALKAPINSPVFTGDPQAPTPAATDNDTSVITSAWGKFGLAFSLGTSGYIKFPTWLSGLIIQWGTTVASTDSGGNLSIAYSIAFPTGVFTFIPSNGDSSVNSGNMHIQAVGGFVTATAASIHATVGTTGASLASTAIRVNWVAFGN